MAKRYFIEIVGIDPNQGIRQLLDAGIQPSRILEIDESNEMTPVLDAIMRVSGVTFADIQGTCRNHNIIIARIIYVYNAIKIGMSKQDIGKDIKKSHSSVQWYITMYKNGIKFDPYFRKIAQKIEDMLVSLKHAKEEQETKKQKKRTDAEIEAILDARQLKIQW